MTTFIYHLMKYNIINVKLYFTWVCCIKTPVIKEMKTIHVELRFTGLYNKNYCAFQRCKLVKQICLKVYNRLKNLLVEGLRSSKSSKVSHRSIIIDCKDCRLRETIAAAAGIKASAATALTSSSGSCSPASQAGRTFPSNSSSIS